MHLFRHQREKANVKVGNFSKSHENQKIYVKCHILNQNLILKHFDPVGRANCAWVLSLIWYLKKKILLICQFSRKILSLSTVERFHLIIFVLLAFIADSMSVQIGYPCLLSWQIYKTNKRPSQLNYQFHNLRKEIGSFLYPFLIIDFFFFLVKRKLNDHVGLYQFIL